MSQIDEVGAVRRMCWCTSSEYTHAVEGGI